MKTINELMNVLRDVAISTSSKITDWARQKPKKATTAGIVLVIALVGMLSALSKTTKNDSEVQPLFEVKKGTLTINITESGTLKNKNEVILKCEVERKDVGAISFLLDEGTIVKPGDLIIELDSAELQDVLETSTINVKKSEAELISTEELLEITKNQAKADVAQAELDLKFAKLDMERFTEGVHPQNLESADADITIAEEDLERTQEDLAWSKKLHEQGFITRTELKADELSEKQKQITLKLKKTDQKLLVKYTHPQEIETLKANHEQAEMALERANRKAKAEVVMAEADLLAQQSELSTMKQRLEKVVDHIAKSRIVAPTNGMVVYAGGGHGRWGNDKKQIEVGSAVHFRQPLIRLSGGGEMIAELSIQEASRPKIKEDMPAIVTVDALPGKVFTGKLVEIGILPDSTQRWLNPDLKVYKCEVELDGSNLEMRPEMRCQVEIIIEEHEDVMFVPVQCVLQVDGKPTVFVKTWKGFEKRAITTGLDNNVMAHIISGLKEGDEIMLAPPLEEGTKNGNGNNGKKRGKKKK